MPETDQLFADYEAKLEQAQQRAERVRDGLAEVRVREHSADGQIEVTVNATGNVVDLRLGNGAREQSGSEIARVILNTMRRAQSKLADAVREAIPTLEGTDTMTELMSQYHTAFPVPEPHAVPGRPPTMRFGPEETDSTPDPAGARPERPKRPVRRSTDGEDEDYSGPGVLRSR